MPLQKRRDMIDKDYSKLSIIAQCDLLDISRSGYYYEPRSESKENLEIMNILDHQYLETPFYGSRKLAVLLKNKGFEINRKRLIRLMAMQGWQTLYPTPRTTFIDPVAYKYPYLLKTMTIDRVNQVWAIDITYIPMKSGFMYLCAIVDIYSRFVVGWGLSNTMTAEWCCDIIKDTIETHGTPEIINSDQGSQFTSDEYIKLLKSSEIRISMDSRGRAIDNIFIERFWRTIKYEKIYLNPCDDGYSLYLQIKDYMDFYNYKRPHQSLNDSFPIQFFKHAA